MRLFHVSEGANIERFIPRRAPALHQSIQDPVVWAVAEPALWTYLVPRECPRVTFGGQATSDQDDIERYLDGEPEKKVLAIESAWIDYNVKMPMSRPRVAATKFVPEMARPKKASRAARPFKFDFSYSIPSVPVKTLGRPSSTPFPHHLVPEHGWGANACRWRLSFGGVAIGKARASHN